MDFNRLIRALNERRLIGHEMRHKKKVTSRYFMRVRNDDFIMEFVVVHPTDPNQFVDTILPDGTHQKWDRREGTGIDAGCYVFRPPPGYAGGALLWSYDKTLQE